MVIRERYGEIPTDIFAAARIGQFPSELLFTKLKLLEYFNCDFAALFERKLSDAWPGRGRLSIKV